MTAFKFGIVNNIKKKKKVSIPEGLYLHDNGVTVCAEPTAAVGWYEFDAGDGVEWFYLPLNKVALQAITNKFNIDSDIYGEDAELSITASGETHVLKCNNVVTTKVTSLDRVFDGRSQFNQRIDRWDVKNVIDAYYFLNGASKFNQKMLSYDTRSFTDMRYCIRGTGLESGIKSWDVSNVSEVNMIQAVHSSLKFNEDLSGWCVSGISRLPSNFGVSCPSWVLPKPLWGEPCKECSDGSKHHEGYTCP